MKAQVGLIGLAVMGMNLARNISGKGFKTVVFNRTTEKTKEYITEFGNDHLVGEETIEAFVQNLETPRKIILLVKAGDAVESVIQELMPLLDKGDTIIDCGNSNYHDTIRRNSLLSEKGLHFVGCGISGGEEGALHGPSLMPGGSDESWEVMKSIWESIAAKDFSGAPCVTHIGADGAGHYVKMVHNGIEYGVMQMIAEAYDLLRRLYDLNSEQVAEIFEAYGKGKLQSYLFEIVLPVLGRKDEMADGFLIDHILDKAEQKGTGKWTAMDALERGVGLSTLSEAVFARINSSSVVERIALAKEYPKTKPQPDYDLAVFTKKLEQALYGGMLGAYAQGFELIKSAAEENNWQVNLSEIARIWQGGCIIRAKILGFLTDVYKKSGTVNPYLLTLEEIKDSLNSALPDWRVVISESIMSAVPTPALTSALQYVDTVTNAKLPANLIQGLRDYFGAHTYERTDREGSFHTKWI
jgi:6-phosphogluconate dehydrogenase